MGAPKLLQKNAYQMSGRKRVEISGLCVERSDIKQRGFYNEVRARVTRVRCPKRPH